MKIAAIIPSRYNSTRFTGKPLIKINNITMIERVYMQVKKSNRFSNIIVATDDKRIADEVKKFGGNFVLTSPKHQSGTERLWEVLEGSDFDAAINVQGDEPLISEKLIADIFDELKTGKHDVLTAAYFNNSFGDYLSENVVKVVFDENFRALYFSRSPIPFLNKSDFNGFYQHIGIYGYLKTAVKAFINFSESKLERIEKLEQLRFLAKNVKIDIIISKYKSIGVDVPEDVKRIENILRDENV